jgi:hypothetical protein
MRLRPSKLRTADAFQRRKMTASGGESGLSKREHSLTGSDRDLSASPSSRLVQTCSRCRRLVPNEDCSPVLVARNLDLGLEFVGQRVHYASTQARLCGGRALVKLSGAIIGDRQQPARADAFVSNNDPGVCSLGPKSGYCRVRRRPCGRRPGLLTGAMGHQLSIFSRSRSRRRPQCRGFARCSRSLNVQAKAGQHEELNQPTDRRPATSSSHSKPVGSGCTTRLSAGSFSSRG